MRVIANYLVTTGLVALAALAAMPAQAANLEASSSVDTVTVYPDGASVTRVIAVDLSAGDNTVVVDDFPLGLDRSSLRVEGEADAKLTYRRDRCENAAARNRRPICTTSTSASWH